MEKLNLLNSVSIGTVCSVKTYNTGVQSAIFWPRHRLIIILLLFHLPVENTLLEVGAEIPCSDVQVATVAMETTQLVLSQFKNCLVFN